MNGMSGMDMGGMDMGTCKSSMTWNWYTIDACIFSDSWHVKSRGMFAGSCIGVIFLVITLELLRRLQREHNSVIQRQNQRPVAGGSAKSGSSASEEEGRKLNDDASSARSRAGLRVNPVGRMTLLKQQLVRAAIHTLQFGVAYIIMLIAMSFNGYLIICILIGAFLGSLAFSFDQICYPNSREEAPETTGCCG